VQLFKSKASQGKTGERWETSRSWVGRRELLLLPTGEMDELLHKGDLVEGGTQILKHVRQVCLGSEVGHKFNGLLSCTFDPLSPYNQSSMESLQSESEESGSC
jgi:hypothetical protein